MKEESEFLERVSKDEIVEAKDWMPQRYRDQLVRQMSQHAHSEVVGMLPESEWIGKAPSLKRKLALLAKVQDEAGHGLYIYSATETLGANRHQLLDDLLSGKAKYSHIFNYPTLSWADIGMIGWLVDGAAIINQTTLAKCSYGPYARAMLRICKEENFHKKQGMEIVYCLTQGTKEQKEMAQESFNRWWWPTLMMFGPHDSNSPNSKETMQFKIKLKSNDELRQRYIDMTVPQAHAYGLTIPDPDLKLNTETGHWEIGPINWEEFWEVLKGNGPCNKERIQAKQNAHAEGAWVREALQQVRNKNSVTAA